jgi:limonene-1,2-epoxide hydrolase
MTNPSNNTPMQDTFLAMARAWETQQWRTCADLFAPDGVLHSVMLEPIRGREAIYARICGLSAPGKHVRLHIHRMGVIDDALFVERSDEIVVNGRSGQYPVVGVLTFEDGLIKLWREYYDRAQLERAVGHRPAAATAGQAA